MSELNLRPDEFWALTYAEFAAMAEGNRTRTVNRMNEVRAGAWYAALWSRVEHRYFPKFADIIQSELKSHVAQTDQQMLETCRLLNAAYGGEVVETH